MHLDLINESTEILVSVFLVRDNAREPVVSELRVGAGARASLGELATIERGRGIDFVVRVTSWGDSIEQGFRVPAIDRPMTLEITYRIDPATGGPSMRINGS